MRWRLTCRARLPLMVASPSEMRSTSISLSSTCRPASAHTWAMPLPICPAPITPTRASTGGSAHSAPPVGSSLTSIFISGALQFGCQLGQCGEQISHQAIVGNLEDGRFLILVNRHDHLAVLHAGQMLDGTRNTDSNVKLRGDNLSGLPNLIVVGHEAGIHRGA